MGYVWVVRVRRPTPLVGPGFVRLPSSMNASPKFVFPPSRVGIVGSIVETCVPGFRRMKLMRNLVDVQISRAKSAVFFGGH